MDLFGTSSSGSSSLSSSSPSLTSLVGKGVVILEVLADNTNTYHAWLRSLLPIIEAAELSSFLEKFAPEPLPPGVDDPGADAPIPPKLPPRPNIVKQEKESEDDKKARLDKLDTVDSYLKQQKLYEVYHTHWKKFNLKSRELEAKLKDNRLVMMLRASVSPSIASSTANICTNQNTAGFTSSAQAPHRTNPSQCL